MLKNLFIGLSFILAISACSKNTNTNQSINIPSRWQVVSYSVSDQVILTPEDYILELKKDNEATLSLDVNNCFSDYTLTENHLTIGGLSCTEICCDADIAQELVFKIAGKHEISFRNEKLRLTKGIDRIILREVE